MFAEFDEECKSIVNYDGGLTTSFQRGKEKEPCLCDRGEPAIFLCINDKCKNF